MCPGPTPPHRLDHGPRLNKPPQLGRWTTPLTTIRQGTGISFDSTAAGVIHSFPWPASGVKVWRRAGGRSGGHQLQGDGAAGPQDVGLHVLQVREVLHCGGDAPLGIHPVRVLHQMAVGQSLALIRDKGRPVGLSHCPDPLGTLEGVGGLEDMLKGAQVLGPQAQPEATDLALGEVPPGLLHRMGVLHAGDGDLRVSRPIHGALVDVAGSDQDQLVVKEGHLGVDVDLVPPGLEQQLLLREEGHPLWDLRGVARLPFSRAAEEEVVCRVRPLRAVLLDGLAHQGVHHLDCLALPEQDALQDPRVRLPLGVHGDHDVHHEPLTVADGADNAHGDLVGDTVLAWNVVLLIIEDGPVGAGPQEVLVLHVDELLGPPDVVDVRLLTPLLHIKHLDGRAVVN
mmetsp:Transcript_104433/g.179951  ORF Transcript_104433/g.179951 Transcript_104433/m.179951 type:complete len:397 (-) Transcript_104433:1426-2616(-)